MKTLILAVVLGTRLGEETSLKPKPGEKAKDGKTLCNWSWR